jgi:hypothetical protein
MRARRSRRSRASSGAKKVRHGYQIVCTGYFRIGSSPVTKSRPSATAWAIRMQSNGSLCSIGSAAKAVRWLGRIGSTRADVSSVARRHQVGRSPIVSVDQFSPTAQKSGFGPPTSNLHLEASVLQRASGVEATMIRMTFIAAVAALAVGCSKTDKSQTNRDNMAGAQASSSARSNEPARPDSNGQASLIGSDVPDQVVTLTGCLIGGEIPVATAGSSARPPVASRRSADEELALRQGSAAAGRFMLMRAKPASGAAGIGANGAGGSGGPLVAGVADYALDGIPAELAPLVNHQVTVTARINPRPSTAEAPPADSSAGSNNQPARPASGSRNSSAPSTSSGAAADTAIPPTAPRKIVVESVQMLSATCAQQ